MAYALPTVKVNKSTWRAILLETGDHKDRAHRLVGNLFSISEASADKTTQMRLTAYRDELKGTVQTWLETHPIETISTAETGVTASLLAPTPIDEALTDLIRSINSFLESKSISVTITTAGPTPEASRIHTTAYGSGESSASSADQAAAAAAPVAAAFHNPVTTANKLECCGAVCAIQ